MMKVMVDDFFCIWCIFTLVISLVSSNSDLDEFNYDQTTGDSFGPSDWIQVGCSDLQKCRGWPDAWEMASDWELKENHCHWCPAEDDSLCGNHHQSPIDLERNRALESHPMYNELAYHDSSCDFETLREKKAFTVERHALKITQPLEPTGVPDEYRLACEGPTGARTWGKIDFSRGFSHWWHLSHIDFHVPSEHTQEGKRYSGEIQMYHWYSVNATVAGIHNEMAAVSVFLEEFDDSPDNDVLNRIICQWREYEETTREACDLASVKTHYPGCYYYTREADDVRRLRKERAGGDVGPKSAGDLILGNRLDKESRKTILLEQEEEDNDAPFDWDAFIKSYLKASDNEAPKKRHLMDYNHVDPWFNYFPMLDVRTEYYYRYSGSQTVPPCYGEWFSGNDRRQTNHWRVMKDPIRVSRRQIDEMHRLLRERIAPFDDPVRPCQPDTAAKQFPNSTRVSVARPVQSTRGVHFEVFCECDDWTSKWPEDQKWCAMDKLDRLYRHPYNFETETF
eukprot:scaffold184_cov179-Amphora_coffeaeformis.AAC.5